MSTISDELNDTIDFLIHRYRLPSSRGSVVRERRAERAAERDET